MKLATVTLNKIKFDAYYNAEFVKDPLGTGDSPTEVYVDLVELSLQHDTTNLIDFFHNYWIEQATEQLEREEWEQNYE